MDESPNDIHSRIKELERELEILKSKQHTSPEETVQVEGNVEFSQLSKIDGIAVGVNLGTIVYGREPLEDERQKLVAYLQALVSKLAILPLRGLDRNLGEQGHPIELPAVYTLLGTRHYEVVKCDKPKELTDYLDKDKMYGLKETDQFPLASDFSPDQALPDQAIVSIEQTSKRWYDSEEVCLWRARLAAEAVYFHKKTVLCGDHGSGKSTFVHYLAWALAQHGLEQVSEATILQGWDDTQQILPVILPLRTLSEYLARLGMSEKSVSIALAETMANEYDYGTKEEAEKLLRNVLRQQYGAHTLLLFDGLDEVPLKGTHTFAGRLTTLQAIRSFTHLYPNAMVVVTCRSRAFSDDLRKCLDWQVEMLAPFTMGQIRHFIPAWYEELSQKTALSQEQAKRLSNDLLTVLQGGDKLSEKLRKMAATPLLLTMMALVLYNEGELPRVRPEFYEKVLELLLERWDKEKSGQTIGKVVGRTDWSSKHIRPVLDKLSYIAHGLASTKDALGELEYSTLRDCLEHYFCTIDEFSDDEAASAAVRFLKYMEERSGLLLAISSSTYTFVHHTLQEHCAGRHIMLNSENPVALVMQRREDERWREPIFLGIGRADQRDINDILSELIAPEENGQTKPPDRWYRDLILAAEIGSDRDWKYLRTQVRIKVEQHLRNLVDGLMTLLNDDTQPLPLAERVKASFLLGDLGDLRFPVKVEEWQATLSPISLPISSPKLSSNTLSFQLPFQNYWHYIQSGTYHIGITEKDNEYAESMLPAFWIARYPVTVAQYAQFIKSGGYENKQWWTPNGWTWKLQEGLEQPWGWRNPQYTNSNQPIIGVTWYEATAFAAWICEQVKDMLPDNYHIRLPTEAEWEVAASYDNTSTRYCKYPWGNNPEPTPELAIFNESYLEYPAPVGCCPAGTSSCGALDMLGNVWEITTSKSQDYPHKSGVMILDFENEIDPPEVAWRGGCWSMDRTDLYCSARISTHPNIAFGYNVGGMRLVVAPCIPETEAIER